MSLILAEWATNQVGLSQPVDARNLERQFQSGHLLGELLLKLDVISQDDFAQLSSGPSSSVDAAVKNFIVLERLLRQRLNLTLKFGSAFDVITGKPGCVGHLLQQIKASVDSRAGAAAKGAGLNAKAQNRVDGQGRAAGVSVRANARSPMPGRLPSMRATANTAAESADETGMDTAMDAVLPSRPAGRTTQATRLSMDAPQMKKFHEKQDDFFASRLKQQIKRNQTAGYKVLDHPKLQHPEYDDEKILQQMKQGKQMGSNRLAPARESSISPSPSKLGKKSVPNKKGVLAPISQKPVTTEYDRAHLIRESEKAAKKQELLERRQAAIVEEQSTRIEVFEKQVVTGDMSRTIYGADGDDATTVTTEAGDDGMDSNAIKTFMTIRAPMDPVHHVKILSKMLPPSDEGIKQSKEFLHRINVRKQEEEASRKERDQRRRKIILAQQNAQEESERTHLDDLLLNKLMRQSKQERRIAEGLMQIRHQKEVMRENRIFREQQYEKRRQKDYEEALAREYDVAMRSREEYRMQTELQMAQHLEILARKAAARHEKNKGLCREIVDQVFDLSIKISDYRALNDGNDVPKRLVREWKTLFVSGQPVLKRYDIELERDKIRLDGAGTGGAGAAGAGTEGDGSSTAETKVEGIEGGAQQGDDAQVLDVMGGIQLLDQQEFQEYLSGSGAWMYPNDTGKDDKPMKNELLGVIVNNVLEMTSPPEPVTELPQMPAVPLKICLIGKRFAGKETVARKLAVQYSLSVLSVDELVRSATNQIDSEREKARSEGMDANRVKKLSSGTLASRIQLSMLEGTSPDDSVIVALVVEAIRRCSSEKGGWVLVDFPRNRNQAQLLEKELSGYEDPKPVKLGNLKRTPKEKDKSASRKRSMIAPVDLKSDNKQPAASSGLDAVFLMDVDNETAIRRAAGRRIDPITGMKYHLELNPPPTDVPGIHERLEPVEDDGNQSNQLQYQLAAFEEQEEPIKEWYSRFQNMRIMDANSELDCIMQVLNSELQEMISKKQKEKERLEELERAAEAAKRAPIPLQPTKEEVAPTPAYVPDEPVAATPANPRAETAGAASVPEVDKKVAPAGPKAALMEEEKKTKGAPGSGKARAQSGKLIATEKQNSRAASAADTKKSDGKRVTTPGQAAPIEKVPEVAPIVELPPEPTQPPIIRTITADGKKLPSRELADVLADQWATIEGTYTETIKYAFRCLRRERETIIRYFHNTKVNFKRYLERPDKKQSLLDLFQLEFNAIEDDLRGDPDAKSELHQRGEDLRERLWEMSDVRREEAESERVAVIEDKWVEDHFAILLNVYITMVQAEVDRYVGTRSLISDYYKDAYGSLTTLPETSRMPIKVPLLNVGVTPPIDIASVLIGGYANSDAAHRPSRRDVSSAGDGRGQRNTGRSMAAQGGAGAGYAMGGAAGAGAFAAATGAFGKKFSLAAVPKVPGGANGAAGGAGGSMPAGGTSDSKHLMPIMDRDHSLMEVDMSIFADLENSLSVAITATNNHSVHEEPVSQEKDKKDKKKGPTSEVPEPKNSDLDNELPSDYQRTIEMEDVILRNRLERIKQHAVEHLKELRNKGIEVYVLLDDWIGIRFQAEMEAIREMLNVIKEAVEMEVRLPNELVLEGERFKVDFVVLTYEPEPEPRPESPVEKQLPDQFTVLQLVNLSRHFRELAPSGNISSKEFVEAIQRMAALSVGTELLPEYYMSAETPQLQQISAVLDPFETGFVSWRRFLISNAHMLPVPSADYLTFLRNAYLTSESYASGKISKADFMKVPLWFEEDADELAIEDQPLTTATALNAANGLPMTVAKFNRPQKLKNALFPKDLFSVLPFDPPRTTVTTANTNPSNSRGNAMGLSAVGEEGDEHRDVMTTPVVNPIEEEPTAAPAPAQAAPPVDPVDLPAIDEDNANNNNNPSLGGAGAGTSEGGQGASANDLSGFGMQMTTGTNVTAAGVKFLTEHEKAPEDGSLFDVTSFLFACVLDDSPKGGLQKAFAVVSERDDWAVTLNQLYQIYHQSLVLVDETNRVNNEAAVEDPIPMDALSRVFEELGLTSPDDVITFEAFIAATAESSATLSSCPLFVLEDVSISGTRSRPPTRTY